MNSTTTNTRITWPAAADYFGTRQARIPANEVIEYAAQITKGDLGYHAETFTFRRVQSARWFYTLAAAKAYVQSEFDLLMESAS